MSHISYELAKELKDAGFPQELKSGYLSAGARPISDLNEKSLLQHHEDNKVYFPTLSEIIEACSEDFFRLKRCQNDEWETETRGEWGTCGSTPSEAVAKLWLALNKK